MKLFAIIRMAGGQPELDQEQTPYHGYVFCDQIQQGIHQWGAYLVSGTEEQLQAIVALSHVYELCTVTEDEDAHWPELEDEVDGNVRGRLNGFLRGANKPDVPPGLSNRSTVEQVYGDFNPRFDLARFDVADVG
jgi:hypothetical protein